MSTEHLYQVPEADVLAVELTHSSKDYDTSLYNLGKGHDQFIIINPFITNKNIIYYIDQLPDSTQCIVLEHKRQWIAKIFSKGWNYSVGYHTVKIVKPKLVWEKNPELDQLMTFENTPIGFFEPEPWDKNYKFIWYIDPKVNPLADKVWAISCHYEGLANKGVKDMGFVMPEVDITIKEDIPRMNIDIDQCYPPFWQISNECAFELTSDQHTLEDKVWVFKFTPRYREPIGWAWIGKIAPLITPIMDVIFISYNEKNAEENWKRVLEKAPHAKRVNGVRGIFNAHKAAAELATTDMFYVVDGDAFLVDDWVFDYNPILLDRNQTHVWYSINPTNGLVYGYGGVKLFPRILFNTTKEWTTLDLTTTIGSEFRIVDKVSNIAAFDTDAYSTWRSAFRECVKLYHNISKDRLDPVHRERINAWLSSSQGEYCKWARSGAIHGVRYCRRNLNEYNILLKINDSQWLEEEFKRITKEIL